jgi:hypothetical protein
MIGKFALVDPQIAGSLSAAWERGSPESCALRTDSGSAAGLSRRPKYENGWANGRVAPTKQ